MANQSDITELKSKRDGTERPCLISIVPNGDSLTSPLSGPMSSSNESTQSPQTGVEMEDKEHRTSPINDLSNSDERLRSQLMDVCVDRVGSDSFALHEPLYTPMEQLPPDSIADSMLNANINAPSPIQGDIEIPFPPLVDEFHGLPFPPFPIDELIDSNMFSDISFLSPYPTESMQDSNINSNAITVDMIQSHVNVTPPSLSSSERHDAETNENPNDNYSTSGRKRTVGKSIETLAQLNKSKKPRPRRSNRSLPLNKRDHEAILASEKNSSGLMSPVSSSSKESSNVLTPLHDSNHTGKLSIEHFTPSDKVSSSIPLDGHLIRKTSVQTCKCSKSKCLKLYCDCFQAGQVCTDSCNCKNCLNTIENSGKCGARTIAIENILIRRPDAFDYRPKKIGSGCSCKKNRCLKKYCDCFNNNIRCKKSCRCIGCKNGKELDCDDDEDLAQASETPKKKNDQSIFPPDIMLPDKIPSGVGSLMFQTDIHPVESPTNKQKESSRVEAV